MSVGANIWNVNVWALNKDKILFMKKKMMLKKMVKNMTMQKNK